MSTNEPMTQEQLDAIRERVDTATDGPWAPWLDQDGKPHMHGRLMVGVAAGVIPDGETWVEGPDVNNPVAETYTPEDRTFISHAREDVPALLAEVHRLRALTTVDDDMVERGARAAYGPKAWDKLDLRDPMTVVQRSAFMAQIRAALEAFTQGVTHGAE